MSFPLKTIAATAVAGATIAVAGALLPQAGDDPTELVTLPARSFDYRVAGEFLNGGVPVNPPLVTVSFEAPVAIMKNHVSRAEYQRCVDAGACKPTAAPMGPDAASVPAVGVSWYDAAAYAAWLSARTGHRYRLPTDQEWAYAAASLFHDNTVVEDGDPSNPSKRWIATYESQAASERAVAGQPQPFGTYGVNERGLIDVAGNIWDWTSTCFARHTLTGSGAMRANESCGVRVVEGAHRTYITDFVRDPSGGACSVGTPPSNLGIRLVRDGDVSIAERLSALLRRFTGAGV